MAKLHLTGWSPGMNVVRVVKLIRAHTGMGLSEAKAKVDRLLHNEPSTIELNSVDLARKFADEASILGVKCELQ
jgi:ribosomal protein L7/L12